MSGSISYFFQEDGAFRGEVTFYGINNAGTVVGTEALYPVDVTFGFFGPPTGLSGEVQYSDATATMLTGINDAGKAVGFATGSTGDAEVAFFYESGSFTTISPPPGAVSIEPKAINNSGDTAGSYVSSDGNTHGYVDIGGVFTTIDLGTDTSTAVYSINNDGDYAGTFLAPAATPGGSSVTEGFDVINGVTTIIDVPGSSYTDVTGINDLGEVVGYDDSSGFVYQDGNYTTIDDPNGTVTYITGVNDAGQLVGYDIDSVYPAHFGFVASPETPCYCRGTLLLTARGEVPVENLRIGDHLVTISGAERPIRWIGTRSYAGRFVAGNRDVLPVVISANALADGIPRRDLSVSPLHAMYLDGMLVPAAALVNGVSIHQMQAVERVEYFHVELETHDVILAEGAAAETFVDDDSRGMFHNAAEYRALYPQAANEPARYCAPRVEGGAALETLFQRLLARSRPAVATASARLLGNLESVDRESIIGWAHDGAKPVRLRILDNGIEIGRVMARGHRDDLRAAGIGDGRGGFAFIVPGGLSPLLRHVIQVQRVSDGRDLAQSPMVLAAEQDMPASPWSAGSAEGMDGYIDELTPHRISGWVRNIAGPDRPVALQIRDNGVPIARVLANRYRPDLTRTKPGSGRYGFEVDIPGGLSPLTRHVITFGREPDGVLLGGPPFIIEAADSFTPAVEQAIAAAVAALRPGAEQARMLAFFTAQAERLRQSGADRDAHRAERQAGQRVRRREARAPRDPELRALVIDERVPAAGRDAGSQAMLSHMHALRRLGYAVSFVAAEEMAADAAALTQDGIVPCVAPFYGSVEDVLRRLAPQAAVHRVAWDVPAAATRAPFAARGGIAFVGAYSHAPNVDAAHWLVEAIMPLVWQRDPSIECRLVGTDMPKSVRRLVRPGVVAVGAVADLDADVFDRVRLTVAPLRYGAGINGKVLASLAAGVPCVMSEIAAEGMSLCPTLGGLVGTDAATLAALICDLHADRAANARAAKAGAAMIRRDFSADAVDAALRRAIAGRGEVRSEVAA
jgi:hypothetical protein